MMSEYPECEKLLAFETDRRMITEFCDWLDANNIFMGRFDDGDRLTTLVESADQLIFEYFGIDPAKVEAEQQRLLSAIRNPTN